MAKWIPFSSHPNLSRYALAFIGNAGSSGAQFALSLVLVAKLPADGFGQFMFLMLLLQFVWAIAGALFAAPMAPLAKEMEQAAIHAPPEPCDFWAVLALMQFAFLVPVCACAFAAAIFVGSGLQMSASYALAAMLGCLRQFGRISQYSRSEQGGVVLSDALFCLGLTTGLVVILATDEQDTLTVAFCILAVAQVLSLIPLLPQLVASSHAIPDLQRIVRLAIIYRSIWSRFSGWSLLGVVSTEATASAHSYLVTVILGTGAYGAIAASGVLTRPGNVALLALGEFERARFAKFHATGGDLVSTRRVFTASAAVVWLGSLILTVIALWWFPNLMSKQGYDAGDLVISAWGWLAVLFIRCAYLPMSTEMQAWGAFRELAWPTVVAMPISVVGTFILIGHFRPAWSLCAIVLGQVVVGGLVWKSYRVLLRKGAPA